MALRRVAAAGLVFALALATHVGAQTPACDARCLEQIAEAYRAAYLAHDPRQGPFAARVRYTENNVEMPFPDGTWDTVTEEVGPALVLSDPQLGTIGIYTAIRQRAVPGFLAVRLKIENRKITEVEHVISTRRNLSSPPTPIGEVGEYVHDPVIAEATP